MEPPVREKVTRACHQVIKGAERASGLDRSSFSLTRCWLVALPWLNYPRWSGFGISLVLALMCVLEGGCSRPGEGNGVEESPLREVRVALAREEFERAERLAEEVAAKSKAAPLRLEARLLVGQASAGRGRYTAALAAWEQIEKELSGVPTDPTLARIATEAAWRAGQVLLHQQHQAAAAEAQFRRALTISPDALPAVNELAHLFAVEGRRSEAIPLILRRMRAREINLDQLALLGKPFGNIDDTKLLEACQRVDRLNPALLLGLASSSSFGLKPDQRRLLLSEAVDAQPTLIDAQVRLGKQLFEERDAAAFLRWHARLPPEADSHPEIWALRGDWALRQNELLVAQRCFAETLRRDANHRGALFQLARLLLQAGEETAAKPLLERNRKLQMLREREDVLFYSEHENVEPIRAVAELMLELGRHWEAWGWSRIALERDPSAVWANDLAQRIYPQFSSLPPLTIDAVNPVRDLNLASLPRPNWNVATAEHQTTKQIQPGPSDAAATTIRFADEAAQVGLDFSYFADSRPAREGKRMFEFTGGGPAVLDLDHDGWPDCYWTQGSRWPRSATQREFLDRLFRNQDGQQFVDVTTQAHVVEPSYSQGVTVGDYDSDGFPDLYVANIGLNRLFHNNGDGTFTDVSEQISGDTASWTTSCLLVDLTGDGLPDLYDVNYVMGDDLFERICTHPDGTPRHCMPFHFPDAPDQLYENQGDGRFLNVTADSGMSQDDGKGLGIVAADFDGSGRLSLFIANDTTPNFFLLNQGPRPVDRQPTEPQPTSAAALFKPRELAAIATVQTAAAADSTVVGNARSASGAPASAIQTTAGAPTASASTTSAPATSASIESVPTNTRVQQAPASRLFVEQGVAAGLAFNSQGRAEGCMGVAVGDADQDGLFDLFVTNFLYETNTLYRQEAGGTFLDLTADFGLAEPSLNMLGFGTQFLDADLDGDEDLIVTNGHVDDLRAYGRPYQMPAQFFTQIAPGRYRELSAEQLGPFFAGKYLGRGLARWDWNRDGREDLLISHLDGPAALLTNRVSQPGHYLAVELRGTRSSREAIGAQVRVQLADRTLVKPLTAGDGYQASNQRRLVFGLGDATRVDRLEIHWPAGGREVFTNLGADQELLFIESDPRSPF